MIQFVRRGDQLIAHLTGRHCEFVVRLAKFTDTSEARVLHDALESWARQTLAFDEYRELFPAQSNDIESG